MQGEFLGNKQSVSVKDKSVFANPKVPKVSKPSCRNRDVVLRAKASPFSLGVYLDRCLYVMLKKNTMGLGNAKAR